MRVSPSLRYDTMNSTKLQLTFGCELARIRAWNSESCRGLPISPSAGRIVLAKDKHNP